MTSAQRRLRTLMRLEAGLFVVAGLGFLLLSEQVFVLSNRISEALGLGLPAIEPSGERFWLVLAFSLLVALATLAWLVQRDVVANYGYVVPLLAAKAASAVCYLVVFAAFERYFIHLTGLASDLLILVVTWVMWRQARPTR